MLIIHDPNDPEQSKEVAQTIGEYTQMWLDEDKYEILSEEIGEDRAWELVYGHKYKDSGNRKMNTTLAEVFPDGVENYPPDVVALWRDAVKE